MRIVVKIAGALLEEPETLDAVAAQIAELSRSGHQVFVVHGGGKTLSSTMARMGIESRFVSGLRVTDAATRDIAVMVLGGLLNRRVVAALVRSGQSAVGVCGVDGACLLGEKMSSTGTDLGYVGYLLNVNVEFLETLWRAGIVPVAACLVMGTDGELYNVNADHLAAAAAEYTNADMLIFLTDVAGVMDGETVLDSVPRHGIESLIQSGKVSGGMVLKLEAAKRALDGGVKQVCIVGGSLPSSLFAAVGGVNGPGTRIEVSQ